MGDQDILRYKLSIEKAIPIAAALITGTFALTTYMNSGQVEALKAQRDTARAGASHRSSDRPPQQPNEISTAEPQAVTELSAQIEALEQEKKVLVSRMADLSRDALDPASELGGLVRQLESDNLDARLAAAEGLFALNDARAVQPLIDYYSRDRREATEGILATRYMQYARNLKPEVGVDFIVRVLESDDSLHAAFAFDVLEGAVMGNDFDVLFAPRLEDIALRSDDALVRTRAKVLIRNRARYLEILRRYEDDGE